MQPQPPRGCKGRARAARDALTQQDPSLPGLVIGIVIALVIRPAVASLCLLGSKLSRRERAFIALVGLKGAVPILLGLLLLGSPVSDAPRLYGVIVIVVAVSVLGQGGLVPWLTVRLGLDTRERPVEPWAFGVRLQEEPTDTRRLTVGPGSDADGAMVAQLRDLGATAWISFVVRDGGLIAARADLALQAGDEVFLIVDDGAAEGLAVLQRVFGSGRAPA